MDNGTAEYAFITAFFAPEPNFPSAPEPKAASSNLFSPISLSADLPADDAVSTPGTEFFAVTPRPRQRTDSLFSTDSHPPQVSLSKEDQAALNATWKQVMDPALDNAKVNISPSSKRMSPLERIATDLGRTFRHFSKPSWSRCRL